MVRSRSHLAVLSFLDRKYCVEHAEDAGDGKINLLVGCLGVDFFDFDLQIYRQANEEGIAKYNCAVFVAFPHQCFVTLQPLNHQNIFIFPYANFVAIVFFFRGWTDKSMLLA